jgi:hypothetical protein
MLILSKPVNQDRLNAAVVEIICLRVMGPVLIPGIWDMHDTLQYIESKFKHPPKATEDKTLFFIHDKTIHFTHSSVVIFPST